MLLLDHVVGWNEERIVTAVTVRADSLFLDDKGMPAHIAIEWMAQTCGALVGVKAIETGQPVRIGFLLGTRDFKSRISRFQVGDRVSISASSIFNDGQMAVFDCAVERDAEVCVTARLNVFQPGDLEAMLREQGVTVQEDTDRA
jgi:predicted hotdog family 3-hydroxylacyl-ACP dehydratase